MDGNEAEWPLRSARSAVTEPLPQEIIELVGKLDQSSSLENADGANSQ